MAVFPRSLLAESAPKSQESLRSITVRSAKIRKEPKFWAPAVAEVQFGDQVEIATANASQAAWQLVSFRENHGYLPLSALSEQRIVFTDRPQPVSLLQTDSEVVLAGKGFNAGIESSYVAASKISVAAIDELEKIVISDKELAAFVAAGELAQTDVDS